MTTPAGWEDRVAALWASIDQYDPADFRARIRQLAGELPAGHPVADFEVAAACDTTGVGEEAAPLYEKALAAGLTGYRRRRAVIQWASTLRNLGEVDRSVALLEAERGVDPSGLDEATAGLGVAVDAFLALALADAGREREALSLALLALEPRLPRYNRSLTNYARALTAAPATS
jgi:tetratricopeptide (TPR) repeat protein